MYCHSGGLDAQEKQIEVKSERRVILPRLLLSYAFGREPDKLAAAADVCFVVIIIIVINTNFACRQSGLSVCWCCWLLECAVSSLLVEHTHFYILRSTPILLGNTFVSLRAKIVGTFVGSLCVCVLSSVCELSKVLPLSLVLWHCEAQYG